MGGRSAPGPDLGALAQDPDRAFFAQQRPPSPVYDPVVLLFRAFLPVIMRATILALAGGLVACNTPAPRHESPTRGAADARAEFDAGAGAQVTEGDARSPSVAERAIPAALLASLKKEVQPRSADVLQAKSLGADPCGTLWWSLVISRPPRDDLPSGREFAYAASTDGERWKLILSGDYDWSGPRLVNGKSHRVQLETRAEVHRLDEQRCGLQVFNDRTNWFGKAEGEALRPSASVRSMQLLYFEGPHLVRWSRLVLACEGDCVEVEISLDGRGNADVAKKRGDPSQLGFKLGSQSLRRLMEEQREGPR